MSKGNAEHTNDILKQKLESFNIEPSPQIWNNIEHSIASGKRNKIIAISTICIAASLLLLLLPTWLIKKPLFQEKNKIYSQAEINNKGKVNQITKNDSSNIFKEQTVSDTNAIILESYPKDKKTIIKNKYRNTKTNKTIVTGDKFLFGKLLAINNKIEIPSKLKVNNDLEKIRENIELLDNSKREFKLQPKIQLNWGQPTSNKNSASVNPAAKTKVALGEFATFQEKSSVIKKSSVKIKADLGINIELPMCKNISLLSGVKYLSFTNDKEKTEAQTPTLGPIKNIDELFQNNSSNSIRDIKQSFSTIEIPLHLRYYIINKRFSFFVTGGIGMNLLINNDADIILSDETKFRSETENLSKISYSGLVGLGLSYNINKSFYLSVEPHFRYYFKSLSNNNDIEIKPNITNISFGLGIKL